MLNKHNKRLIIMFLILATIAISFAKTNSFSYSNYYSDIENHWATSYVNAVSNYGAVSGYTDGTFKPNNHIKRVEFIAAIVNALKLELRKPVQDEYWGQPYIDAALDIGLVDSDEFENLQVEQNISREEMASIVVGAYLHSGGTIDPIITDSKLTDLESVSPIYYEKAVASVALGFISGYSDDTFSPKQHATRAQAAVLMYKLLVKLGELTEADLPENIILSKKVIIQGDILTISIDHVDSASVITMEQALYPNFKWVDTGSRLQVILPTNYSTAPGMHKLHFTNTKTGKTTTRQVEVVERAFRVQRLTVDTRIESSTRTDDAYAEYRKYFNPSRETSSPVKYYSEPFLLPTRGKVTTEFGESRYVNGALTTYRHAGIDIAAPRHTEVISTNTGKVVLSMPLILTGNSIVIDHGEGIFSVYLHLETLNVKEGDMVRRGQLVGTVGSTGFSTGPHLHFTMSYYRFDIEPGFLIYGQSITKQNYLELMK